MKQFSKSLMILAGAFLLASCHESLEDRAAREAKEFTEKQCPSPVRDNTRTDSLTFDKESKTICYWYTLCGAADNADAINKDKEHLTSVLLDGVKSSTDLKAYKDAGFKVRFVYHSEKTPQQRLLDVTFTEKDY